MASMVALRKEIMAMGRELGLTERDLAEFVKTNLDAEMINLEKEREQEDKKRAHEKEMKEREIAVGREKMMMREKEMNHEREMKEKELKIEEERTRQREAECETARETTPNRDEDNASPMVNTQHSQPNHATDPAMAFSFETFDERHDTIDLYLDRFNELASVYKLADDKKALKLSLHLKGTPYEIYSRLPPSSKQDFGEVRDALYRHYNVSAEAYRRRFRTLKRGKTETFQQLCDRLELCLQKWHSMSGMEQDFTGLFQLFLMEQLRDAMTGDVRKFVDQNDARTLDDLIKYADRFLSAQDNENKGQQNPTHGPRDHRAHAHSLSLTHQSANHGDQQKRPKYRRNKQDNAGNYEAPMHTAQDATTQVTMPRNAPTPILCPSIPLLYESSINPHKNNPFTKPLPSLPPVYPATYKLRHHPLPTSTLPLSMANRQKHCTTQALIITASSPHTSCARTKSPTKQSKFNLRH